MSEKETGAAYSAYVLGLADDALIYSHRLGEWLTWAPALEEDLGLDPRDGSGVEVLPDLSAGLVGAAGALVRRDVFLDVATGRKLFVLFLRGEGRRFLALHPWQKLTTACPATTAPKIAAPRAHVWAERDTCSGVPQTSA